MTFKSKMQERARKALHLIEARIDAHTCEGWNDLGDDMMDRGYVELPDETIDHLISTTIDAYGEEILKQLGEEREVLEPDPSNYDDMRRRGADVGYNTCHQKITKIINGV